MDAGPYVVYRATVGPREMLYTPAGYAVTHKVLNSEDCTGFRVGCSSSHQLHTIRTISQHNLLHNKCNAEVSQLQALLESQEAPSTAALEGPGHETVLEKKSDEETQEKDGQANGDDERTVHAESGARDEGAAGTDERHDMNVPRRIVGKKTSEQA